MPSLLTVLIERNVPPCQDSGKLRRTSPWLRPTPINPPLRPISRVAARSYARLHHPDHKAQGTRTMVMATPLAEHAVASCPCDTEELDGMPEELTIAPGTQCWAGG